VCLKWLAALAGRKARWWHDNNQDWLRAGIGRCQRVADHS